MKRVFVSTNYSSLKDVGDREKVPGLSQYFDNLKPERYSNICFWDASTESFSPWNDLSPVPESDLFFINDQLRELPPILSIQRDDDYLLAHENNTHNNIRSPFNSIFILMGHHGNINNSNKKFTYHASVIKILLDNNISSVNKAQEIIHTLWPPTQIERMQRDLYLDQYYITPPKSSEDCPPVFDHGSMRKLFEQLKNTDPLNNPDEYFALLEKLTNESIRDY